VKARSEHSEIWDSPATLAIEECLHRLEELVFFSMMIVSVPSASSTSLARRVHQEKGPPRSARFGEAPWIS
jgi:hypothetical protein